MPFIEYIDFMNEKKTKYYSERPSQYLEESSSLSPK